MKPAPRHIAAILIGLLLAASAMWWPKSPQTARSATPGGQGPERGAAGGAVANEQAALVEFLSDTGLDVSDIRAYAQCSEEISAAINDRARELASRQDADSRLAHAFTAHLTIEPMPEWDESQPGRLSQAWEQAQVRLSQRILETAAHAPNDPDIVWLAASRCNSESEGCLRARQSLLKADPDNVATWLLAMEWARTQGDARAMEAAFQQAAKASEYDPRAGTAAEIVLAAFADVPRPGSCRDPAIQKVSDALRKRGMQGMSGDLANDSIATMASMAETWGASPYASLQEFCSIRQPLPAQRHASCTRIYTEMANAGEALIDEAVALHRLVELTHGQPDSSQWRERYRQHLWIRHQQMEGGLQVDPLEMAMDELGTLRGALEERGLGTAPAGWLPEDERARSLIQTGRSPPSRR